MWIPLAIGAAFCMALTGTLSKAALSGVRPVFVFTIQSVMVAALSILICVVGGQFRADVAKMQPKEMAIIAAGSLTVCAATLLNFSALSLGSASRVQPIMQLSLVFALILAGLFLKERITSGVVVGAAVMFVGALVIAFSGNK